MANLYKEKYCNEWYRFAVKYNYDIIGGSKLSSSSCLTMDIINRHYSEINWDWYTLTRNRAISKSDIKKYPQFPWDLSHIKQDTYDKYDTTADSNINSVSALILLIILSKDQEWSYSRNSHLTLDLIDKYSDKPWDWEGISENSAITMDMIENNPQRPWVWKHVVRNPNLSLKMIKKIMKLFPNEKWAKNAIFDNNLYINDMERYIELCLIDPTSPEVINYFE